MATTLSPQTQLHSGSHLKILDGWRGLSILLVLCCHLFPLGKKEWQGNVTVGILGVSVFFVLSGFLITSFLIKDQNIARFLIRRAARVVPLAWLYVTIVLSLTSVPAGVWLSNYFFYSNLPPLHWVLVTDHFWSLCVEMQFYLFIATLVLLFKTRGLMLLPYVCIGITILRMWHGMGISTISYYRVDDILAGCVLALIFHNKLGGHTITFMRQIPLWPVLILLLVSCAPQGQWLNYFRPYLAALFIGLTILTPESKISRGLNNRIFYFLATISFALYVIHPILTVTWLGTGDVLEKYAKRPLLLLVLFALAIISTKYYESRFIEYGRILSRKIRSRDDAVAGA